MENLVGKFFNLNNGVFVKIEDHDPVHGDIFAIILDLWEEEQVGVHRYIYAESAFRVLKKVEITSDQFYATYAQLMKSMSDIVLP